MESVVSQELVHSDIHASIVGPSRKYRTEFVRESVGEQHFLKL